MEGFKTVKRFTSLNRILFSTALLYLTAFNGTQAWRFVGFEDRVGDLADDVDTAQSVGWNSCSILYPHVFYTFPEIILTVALLYVVFSQVLLLERERVRSKCTLKHNTQNSGTSYALWVVYVVVMLMMI